MLKQQTLKESFSLNGKGLHTGVNLTVYLSGGRNTTVVVPDDQLSLTIGKDGQNASLAAKLTNWRIDIKSVSKAAADILAA